MKKYSFLVYHREYESFLEKLRELGVMHVQEKESGIPEDTALLQDIQLSKRLVGIKKVLSKRVLAVDTNSKSQFSNGFDVADAFEQATAKLESINQQLAHLDKDLSTIEPWGQFSNEKVELLRSEGIEIHFFSCQGSKYNADWEKDGNVFQISNMGSLVYFIQIVKQGEPLIDADPIKLPSVSYKTLREQKDKLDSEAKSINLQLDNLALTGQDLLDAAVSETNDKVDFSKVVLGSEKQAEDRLLVLEGWVPEDDEQAIEVFLKNEKTVFESREPATAEKVPIKLKNNRFNQLFEMISDLYSRPQYNEIDLTPFLAPFYLLFFGFCFGDAGYGLLFVLVASYFKTKSTKENKGIITLVQLLGASTMLFGILGGTFFGISLYDTNLPYYGNAGKYLAAKGTSIQDILFAASLGLGAFQILFGMFLNAYKLTKQSGFRYAISTLSWALLIISFGVNYFIKDQIGLFQGPFLVTGIVFGIGIFFMNTPGKSLPMQFGIGLWDAYNTIVGGVGDLLSYVRLFALALASSILGQVFNELAMPLFTEAEGVGAMVIGFIFMTLILVVGHAINIFMSGLGSMVHPLRLTFVEFYKNAGFEGGGKPFRPFQKQTS